MSLDRGFLLILFIPSALITFFVLRLKKKRLSVCVFVFFCIIGSMFYLWRLFPLWLHNGGIRKDIASLIPVKNIIVASNVLLQYQDGTIERAGLLFTKDIIVYAVFGFFFSSLISSGVYYFKETVVAAVSAGVAICFFLISLRIIAFVFYASNSFFDSVEYIASFAGAMTGAYSTKYLVNNKKKLMQ